MADYAKTRAKFETEEFQRYICRGYIEARPYVPGEMAAGLKMGHPGNVDPEKDLGYVAKAWNKPELFYIKKDDLLKYYVLKPDAEVDNG